MIIIQLHYLIGSNGWNTVGYYIKFEVCDHISLLPRMASHSYKVVDCTGSINAYLETIQVKF